ncbi:hypothetical protein BOQ62_04185 [Chryseobacterium sp. CH21]|uniref:hypothetical protein n=1 Tax=Chryseobacterium sp. CH21 TaxID=713556 RepID=UPI00100AB3B0|nr:hypothetical protein [Chryseobacterium sp. CH21]RXM40774.1 hypothetical protein BOQ62_04185 [Chryseobacterium sp. CH21]
MIKYLFNILFIFLFSLSSYAQDVFVLKDSVCISKECFELQELKIETKNTGIYKKIQKSYDLFNGTFFDSPDKRLNAKKDTLKNLISTNSLRDNQYGFENYKIYLNKNGLLNVSLHIQSYGSPWEDTVYYFFDEMNDTEVGENLFVNKKMLLQVCRKKLKKDKTISFPIKNLSQYKINTNIAGNITGIDFIFYDEKNRNNSGYPEYSVSFTSKEIEKFIAPQYKKRLM